MKIWWTKVADIGWLTAALLGLSIILITGASAQEYAQYRVDGQKLSEQEIYVLDRVKTGKVADLLIKFSLPLIPKKDLQEKIDKLGLGAYFESLDDQSREEFLKNNGDRIRIRAEFLETLLNEGFPGFKIPQCGVTIKGAVILEPLDFKEAEVNQSFYLENSILKEGASFRDSWFKKILCLNDTLLLKTADFQRIKVGKALFVKNGKFLAPVDFSAAEIGGDFSAENARFLNENGEAQFHGLKVGQNASFKKAIFKGPVDFTRARIDGEFNANTAEFHHERNDFDNINIGGPAIFTNVLIKKEIYLSYGTFLDLTISTNPEDGNDTNQERSIPNLILLGSKIRNLGVGNSKIKEFNANSCQVKGWASFVDVEINKARFRDGSFHIIKFLGDKPCKSKESLRLEGLTYDSITVGKEEISDCQKVLELVDGSFFDPQNYLQLENYFRRSGKDDWANNTFISMKNQELDQRPWLNKWLRKIFWGWLAGYGRHPLRVFGISFGLVLIGALLFNPKYLKEDKRPKSGRINAMLFRFFLSLDQFLPGVDLGLAKDWESGANPLAIWAYFTFEQISGYILVPIGLAAIYTQIK